MLVLFAEYMLFHARMAIPSTSLGWHVYVPIGSFLGPILSRLSTVGGLEGCVTSARLTALGPVVLSANRRRVICARKWISLLLAFLSRS